MSNLENIVNKIVDDAKAEADRIKEEAMRANEDITSSKINEANERRKRIIERAKADAVMIKDRIISNAELKVRDEKLKAKQEILDRVFALAKERLKDLDENDYLGFLNNSLNNLDLKGDEVLIVPDKVKSKVKDQGLSVAVSDNETVESGFVLKDKDIIMNFSFDALVNYAREELESEIAQELFKE